MNTARTFATGPPLSKIFARNFRVNSARATQFRQWATGVLRNFAIRGYVLDKERLKNGAFLSKEYYDNLLGEIREIRASERRFYQKQRRIDPPAARRTVPRLSGGRREAED